MSGSTRSSEGLDPRRRRLLFRSWHRGIREADLLMGRFADSHIGDLSEAELDQYERLLDLPDHDIYVWISGEAPIPPAYDTPLMRCLRAFHNAAGSAA
jgi:antitoxin CptB